LFYLTDGNFANLAFSQARPCPSFFAKFAVASAARLEVTARLTLPVHAFTIALRLLAKAFFARLTQRKDALNTLLILATPLLALV
jgi:hypothetical protein